MQRRRLAGVVPRHCVFLRPPARLPDRARAPVHAPVGIASVGNWRLQGPLSFRSEDRTSRTYHRAPWCTVITDYLRIRHERAEFASLRSAARLPSAKVCNESKSSEI